ncbi:ATP-binding protein [Paenibacillus cymbidii]|uniref:ATP-binding protein n=1 Tax=Paenibacillus cymbidii TaxID=1639034 RepID=UPI001F3D912F|nr:ATP-binding protein [Paenibacillus cymbidii]
MSNVTVMTTKRIFLILGIYLLVITGIRLAWSVWQAPAPHPDAALGTLDLKAWDKSSNRTFPLNGEWEFYPFAFYSQESMQPAPPKPTYIRVPGNWKQALTPEGDSSIGYGSYRLVIRIPDAGERLFALRIPQIKNASELYVNGRLLAHSGTPGTDADTYTPRRVPYSASFSVAGDTIEIVIQVANFDYASTGGITLPVKFGTQQAVEKEVWFSRSLQLLVCTILLMHAFYVCLLLFIGGRMPGLISFFLLIVSEVVSILIDTDRLLLVWLPIDFEWSYRLFHLSYQGIIYFLFRYAGQLLGGPAFSRRFRWFGIACALSAGIALFLPLHTLMRLGYFNLPLYLFTILAVPTLAFRAVRRGERNAIFLLIGGATIAVNALWGILKTGYFSEIGNYPLDLIFTVLAVAAYWFNRHISSARQTKLLAEKLQEADKRKDDFLAHTSHELRNPLHGMLNIAQAVLDDESVRKDGNHQDSLRLLITVGQRMSFLLSDLLDIGRLRDNAVILHLSPVRVQALASGVLDMLRFMTEGKPIRLVNRIPDSFPPLWADENRLMQIVFNLLHNAVKFTAAGQVVIDATAQDGRARITVSDTGIGMDEATLRRIFQSYEQADSSITSPGGGIGLGLSICKQLVELHGGTIRAESAPNNGSIFTIELPLAAASAADVTEAAAPSPEAAFASAREEVAAAAANISALPPEAAGEMPTLGTDGIRILAVDDDPVNLRVLARTLSSELYRLGTATNGTEALAMLDAVHWDVVIVDVMMPGMSGYELTRRIRERYTLSELPILLLTARSQPEDIQTGFLAGANDYIVKPMNALEIKSRIRALTDLTLSIRDRMHMEAAWLQAQIRPHFLFNTLSAIVSLGETDTDRMRKLADTFGVYLRASYDFKNSDKRVPLHDELELVRAYLSIEKERFGERLEVQWDVNASSQLLVPPLSIQPLVENAARHGILKRTRGGTIGIRIAEYERHAEVSVADDGAGMDDATLQRILERRSAAERNGIGLINTDRRLKQLYGQGLHIESRPGHGTTVSFRIVK